LIGLLGTVIARDSCLSDIVGKPIWKDISHGRAGFIELASTSKTNALWAILNKKFPSGQGQIIAKYDSDNWLEDPTQPKGASLVAVDSKGMPAFSASSSPRHIWHK